jgi:hypothetical protein
MKKCILILLFALFMGGHSYMTTMVYAENIVDPDVIQTPQLSPEALTSCSGTEENCYQLLEPLPGGTGLLSGVSTTTGGTADQGLGGFMNFIFEIAIGVAGVLGVVMLTIYGFQYAANDKNINTFGVLRERISGVIMGLLLLLGIFIILKTINPDLLVVEPEMATVDLEIDNLAVDQGVSGSGNSDIPLNISNILDKNVTTYDPVLKEAAQKAGIDCALLKAFMYVESSGGQSTLSPVGARGIIQIMPTTAYDTAPAVIRAKVAADFPGQTISYKWGASQQAVVHASLKRNGIDLDVPKTNATMAAQLIKGFIDKPGNSQGTGIVRYAAHAYNGGKGANSNGSCGKAKWICGQGKAENRSYGPKIIRSYGNIINNQWSCDISSKGKGFKQLDI